MQTFNLFDCVTVRSILSNNVRFITAHIDTRLVREPYQEKESRHALIILSTGAVSPPVVVPTFFKDTFKWCVSLFLSP